MCQWSCNFTPHQCRSGFSATVSLRQWYRFSPSDAALLRVAAQSNPDLWTRFSLRLGPPPLLAKCSHQCSYQQKVRLARCVGSGRVLPLLLKCPSVSPQLFREVRIMKILNHPNIGEFRREHAAASFDSSATLLQFSSACTRNQHNLALQVQKFRESFCVGGKKKNMFRCILPPSS